MTRNSRIILASGIKLDKSYLDVVWKYSHEMVDICREKAVAESDDFSFIRQNGTVSVPYSIDVCLSANYLAFQNPDYSNKWFFGWIDDCIYINDGCTEIRYTIDIWSTWFDNWVRASETYIERQMAVVDSWENPAYINTQPENLNIGPSYRNNEEVVIDFSENYISFLASGGAGSSEGGGASVAAVGAVYNGVYSALSVSSGIAMDSAGINSINNTLKAYIENGTEDRIVKVFQYPKTFGISPRQKYERTITDMPEGEFEGYQPRNQKLHTFPYKFLKLYTSNGDSVDLPFENFEYINGARVRQVKVVGGVIPTVSALAYPLFYLGQGSNYAQGVSMNFDIECPWTGDSYQRWLAVNQDSQARARDKSVQNILTSTVGGAAGGAAAGSVVPGVGSLMGGIFGGISGAFTSIVGHVNLLADQDVQQKQAALQSNSVHGSISTSGLQLDLFNAGIHLANMSIRKEYAQAIDDYFDLYGYAWNKLDTPNIDSRPYFNYLKIAPNARIESSTTAPSVAMEVINNVFRNGVRIWKDIDDVGDLSLASVNH